MLSRTEMSFCSASTSNHFNIIKNNKSTRIVFPTLLWGLMIACFLVLVQPFCSFAEDTGLFGDGRLTLYANHESKSQSLSCIIETGEGGLIVIDGGWNINSEFLLKQIQAKGGHVQAWLLTHPDSDHVGAITTILNHHSQDITIDGIYCSFLDDDWYKQYCDQGCQQTVYALKDALSRMPEDVVHDDIEAGQIIEAGPATIQVLNSAYAIEKNTSNNSSVVYLVSLNGTNVVFLGDLGEEGGRQLMEDVDLASLNRDIVQAAHHGQNGVDFEFYKELYPQIALFPTPKWLWNNDAGCGPNSGGWDTKETRDWMARLCIKIYCTKNGDQVLE